MDGNNRTYQMKEISSDSEGGEKVLLRDLKVFPIDMKRHSVVFCVRALVIGKLDVIRVHTGNRMPLLSLHPAEMDLPCIRTH